MSKESKTGADNEYRKGQIVPIVEHNLSEIRPIYSKPEVCIGREGVIIGIQIFQQNKAKIYTLKVKCRTCGYIAIQKL